jgi:phosphatidylinositol alpha-mannosyltransferase
VVASNLPGYAELLPASAGRLIPPGRADALADALRAVLEDSDLRGRMGRAGQEAARRYDWRLVADEVLDSYREAFARRARAAGAARRPSFVGRKRPRRVGKSGPTAFAA